MLMNKKPEFIVPSVFNRSKWCIGTSTESSCRSYYVYYYINIYIIIYSILLNIAYLHMLMIIMLQQIVAGLSFSFLWQWLWTGICCLKRSIGSKDSPRLPLLVLFKCLTDEIWHPNLPAPSGTWPESKGLLMTLEFEMHIHYIDNQLTFQIPYKFTIDTCTWYTSFL